MSITLELLALSLAVSLFPTAASAQMGAWRPVTEHPLAKNQAAVESGERRFKELCSTCHGARGDGGQGEGSGPNLVTSWEGRRATDARLNGFIRNGIPGTGMPPFDLPPDQITEIAAFVRSLNSPAASTPVHGDVAAGQAIFTGKGGCANCHIVNGHGGYLGPDLSNVGATLRLDELRKAVLQGRTVAAAGYRPVWLQTGQGRVRGIVRHESRWSMQILDENGNLHLLHGNEMAQATSAAKSWMPDDFGRRLTAEELGNLIAYLSRQAVRPPGQLQVSVKEPQ